MKRVLLLLSAAMVVASVMVALAGSALAVDGPPTVVKTDPAEVRANPIDVSSNVNVKIWFSEPMDPSTINSSTLYILQGCGYACGLDPIVVPATVTYNAKKNLAIINPSVKLQPEQYLVVIEGDSDTNGLTVRDSTGVAMTNTYTFRFRVR